MVKLLDTSGENEIDAIVTKQDREANPASSSFPLKAATTITKESKDKPKRKSNYKYEYCHRYYVKNKDYWLDYSHRYYRKQEAAILERARQRNQVPRNKERKARYARGFYERIKEKNII